MRLLFASPHRYLPDAIAGRDISMHSLLARCRQAGAAVAVLAERPDAGGRDFARDEGLGYPVYRAAEPAAALAAVLADWQPDVAIYPFDPRGLPLLALGLQAGVKAALHITNVESLLAASPVVRPDVALIANSRFTARRVETLLGFRPPVVPPVIEPERYRVPSAGDAVLLVNPSLRKDVDLFFRLAAARPEIPFLVVESWTVRAAWRAVLVNRARALGNVALWESVEDMRAVYARTRLALIPSVMEETFGRVVAEAALSGIPALVAARGALPETLGGGGLAVPLDAGIEPWLQALDRLWSDRAFYAACSAAALAESAVPERAPERIAAGFLELLGRL